MAQRPVFTPRSTSPYRDTWTVEFNYNSGFAVTQKQKNITAIHNAFHARFPDKKVLEISSKSMQEGGVELSAFNLCKYVPSLNEKISVERIYQASKVFRNGGPYTDLLHASKSSKAKRDTRLQESGPLIGFRFEGQDFPLEPAAAFYDFLYINALLENEDLAKIVLEYDAFTDVEFSPDKSISCQAKSAAMFVALHRLGYLDKVKNFDDFLKVLNLPKTASQQSTSDRIPGSSVSPAGISQTANKMKAEEKNNPAPEETVSAVQIPLNTVIKHKIWGEGTVTADSGTLLTIVFSSVGEKKLGKEWVIQNCSIKQ